MTASQIEQRFGLVGKIQKVNMIKSDMGQYNGRAIVEFEKESSVTEAIEKFNDKAVDSIIN